LSLHHLNIAKPYSSTYFLGPIFQKDIKFNAITGNYYTAPIAFLALAGPFLYFEVLYLDALSMQAPSSLPPSCFFSPY
jgi:hypothetical protein